jgi:hypothetical protein
MFIVQEKVYLILNVIPSLHLKENDLQKGVIVAGELYYLKMNMKNGNLENQ